MRAKRIGSGAGWIIVRAASGFAALSPAAAAADEPPMTGRIMRKQVIVPATLDQVWHCWTTEEGIATFFSKESHVELRPGGAFDIYFSVEPDREGKRGAEGMKILSYVPREMLAFEWGFPPSIPSLRYGGARTQVVLRFFDLGDGRVKVSFAQLGWREGEDWQKGYEYFDNAWSRVLGRLKDHFEERSGAKKRTGWQRPVPAERVWIDGHVQVTVGESLEKYQAFELEVPAGVQETWNLLATRDGFKRLGAKKPKVELRPGGAYSFWPGAPNKVLAFVPCEVLSTSGSAPEQFPNVRKGGTWSAYFFEPLGDDRTRVRLVCLGWRAGEKEWDDAFDYFVKANPQFLNHVHGILAGQKRAAAAKSRRADSVADRGHRCGRRATDPLADIFRVQRLLCSGAGHARRLSPDALAISPGRPDRRPMRRLGGRLVNIGICGSMDGSFSDTAHCAVRAGNGPVFAIGLSHSLSKRQVEFSKPEEPHGS